MVVAVVAPAAYAKYPQDALQCMASRKEPEGQLICPEHRYAYLPLWSSYITGGVSLPKIYGAIHSSKIHVEDLPFRYDFHADF